TGPPHRRELFCNSGPGRVPADAQLGYDARPVARRARVPTPSPAMPTRTNHLRSNLDALEAREVCWTAGQLGSLSSIVHLGAITPPSPQLHVADSVFTLANQTEHSLTFTVQWQGSSAVESYTLMPGESRQIWVRDVERFPVARTALIRMVGG